WATGTHSCALVTAMITSGLPSAAAAICDDASVAVSGSETTLPTLAPLAPATERITVSNTGPAGMSRLMTLMVLALPSVARYFVHPAQSATASRPNANASFDSTSSGVTPAAPTRGTPAFSMMGTLPAVPSSLSPTKATGCFSSNWLAHADDCSGEPSVTQVSSLSGRPAAPPSAVLTNLTAACAARRESGSAAGPLSWLIMASSIGSPWAGAAVTAGAAAGADEAGAAGAADEGGAFAVPELLHAPTATAATTVPTSTAARRPVMALAPIEPSSSSRTPSSLRDSNRFVKRKRFTSTRSLLYAAIDAAARAD